MHPLNAKAGRKAMVYGGEKKRRSTTRVNEGIAWNEMSVWKGSGGAQSGRTSFGSIWM
jgi:hypothetical protein